MQLSTGKRERSPVWQDWSRISLTDVSIPEECLWARCSHPWFEELKCHKAFCFSECENAPRKKFTAWRHMRISDAWSSIMEWSEGSVVLRSFKYQWGGRQFKQKVKSRCERNLILILKLYWQHHEEGIISAPNSGESVSFIFFWNNPCAINVKTIFCEKEEFFIWMHFETLWNAAGLLHLCNGV